MASSSRTESRPPNFGAHHGAPQQCQRLGLQRGIRDRRDWAYTGPPQYPKGIAHRWTGPRVFRYIPCGRSRSVVSTFGRPRAVGVGTFRAPRSNGAISRTRRERRTMGPKPNPPRHQAIPDEDSTDMGPRQHRRTSRLLPPLQSGAETAKQGKGAGRRGSRHGRKALSRARGQRLMLAHGIDWRIHGGGRTSARAPGGGGSTQTAPLMADR